MSKKNQMITLIQAGMYDVNSPGIVDELRRDFYAPGSNAATPEKVVRQLRRQRNAQTRSQKTTKPICRTAADALRFDCLRSTLFGKKTKSPPPSGSRQSFNSVFPKLKEQAHKNRANFITKATTSLIHAMDKSSIPKNLQRKVVSAYTKSVK